jgi:hypothetical protein
MVWLVKYCRMVGYLEAFSSMSVEKLTEHVIANEPTMWFQFKAWNAARLDALRRKRNGH